MSRDESLKVVFKRPNQRGTRWSDCHNSQNVCRASRVRVRSSVYPSLLEPDWLVVMVDDRRDARWAISARALENMIRRCDLKYSREDALRQVGQCVEECRREYPRSVIRVQQLRLKEPEAYVCSTECSGSC